MVSILLLCPGNATRSILGEAILKRDGAGRIDAHSAGTNPMGVVPRATLDCLIERGLPVAGLRSKGWGEFLAPGAPRLDLVISLCPTVAGEVHPDWPGRPAEVLWPLDEPLAAPAEQVALAMSLAYHRLSARLNAALALPLERMSRDEIEHRLAAIEPA